MFFDRFRTSVAELPAGLIRIGPPAEPDRLEGLPPELRRRLPERYVAFLRSFDGVDLFHESVVVAGVGPATFRRIEELQPDDGSWGSEPVFAEALSGDRFVFDSAGQVIRLRAESEERWLAGSEFSRWLDALIAHERVLFGKDGEFLDDAFEADGEEIRPTIALRQSERALRADPGSAELHHERAVALRRLGRPEAAREAFARAAELDPSNPWAAFDHGRAALALGPAMAREAHAAFRAAAGADTGEAAGRLWLWAARAAKLAGLPEAIASAREQALARAPALATSLRRSIDAAHSEADPEAVHEAEALLDALEGPIPAARVRLPVAMGSAPPVRAVPPVPEVSAPESRRPREPRPNRRTAPPRPRPARTGRPARRPRGSER